MDAAPPTCQGVCMSVQKQFQCVCNRFYKIIVHPSNTNLSLPSLLSAVQCPAHDVRYDSSGVILSPGWPESYPNLQMCSWSVTVEKGYNVTITFESFHTEREFDVLEIFDGKKSLKELHSPKHNTDTQCRKNSAKKCCSFFFFFNLTHTHTHTHTHTFFLKGNKGLFLFSSPFIMISLRFDTQQSNPGDAERRLANALQHHNLWPPVPRPLVLRSRHEQERLQNSLCWWVPKYVSQLYFTTTLYLNTAWI